MRRPFVAFGLAAGVYVLLTAALTWPLVLHPGSVIPNDLGDSLLNIFLLVWNARVVPFTDAWWNLPQFYPIEGAMAFSEHLLGLSVLSTPVIWTTGNAVLAYNVAFFFSFPLCALGAHALCYELTGRHDASLIAGIAYGFAPYRMSQLAHVQVLSAYWIPLALLALHLCLRQDRWRWAVVFAGSWWLQSLANGYYLFYLSVLVALWLIWFVVAGRRWAVLAKVLAAWLVGVVALLPVAIGYLRWQRFYGLRRWPDEIESFSADVLSILSVPGNLRLWQWLNVVERPESQLFPGLTLVAVVATGVILAWVAAARYGLERLRTPRILFTIAAIFAIVSATPRWIGPWTVELFGVRLLSVRTPQKPFSVALLAAVVALAMHPSIRAGWRRRSPLAFYAIAAVVMWLFSLGPAPTFLNEPMIYKAPYSWLLMLPGVEGVRVPARFWVLATMCLALAGGLAYAHIIARWPVLRSGLAATVCCLLLIEAWPHPVTLNRVPSLRPASAAADMRLELPSYGARDLIALFRAVEHRRPVLNGYSGYFAPHYWALQHLLQERDTRLLDYVSGIGSLELVIDHDHPESSGYIEYLAGYPRADLVRREEAYTVYRVPAAPSSHAFPHFAGQPLPIAAIRASPNQELVAAMTDGDRISRWHTGPQRPGNEVIVDLGAVRAIAGVELQIGGYIADFPRGLSIDVSDDELSWRTAWTGSPSLVAVIGALHEPFNMPLRFPFERAAARYIRMRQTSSDPVYYWTISELRVYGE